MTLPEQYYFCHGRCASAVQGCQSCWLYLWELGIGKLIHYVAHLKCKDTFLSRPFRSDSVKDRERLSLSMVLTAPSSSAQHHAPHLRAYWIFSNWRTLVFLIDHARKKHYVWKNMHICLLSQSSKSRMKVNAMELLHEKYVHTWR